MVPNTIYSYRLVAHGPDGDSDPSNDAVALIANEPPVIGAIPDQTVTLGEQFTLQVPATDDGNGTTGPGGTTEGLTYEPTETPDDGMEIDPNSGVITWHPQDPAYVGQTYVVGVKVTDGAGASSVRQFALTIQAVPPAFDVTVSASAAVVTGTDVTLTAAMTGDVPAGDVTYSWAVLAKPRGVDGPTFGTGTTQKMVTFTAPGSYSFQVTATASDGTSGSAARSPCPSRAGRRRPSSRPTRRPWP